MSHEAPEFPACAICGRTILRGERAFSYRSADGGEEAVCALCRDAAEAREWLPADAQPPPAEPQPEPVASRAAAAVRERLAHAAERLHRPKPEPRETPAPAPEPRRLDEGPRTPELLARRALEFFNATDQPRKVAGLARSLGDPSVSASADLDRGAVQVVVAWELSWYRWEVGPDGQVRQTGRGDELNELEPTEREWNARAGPDGRLRLEARP